MESRLHIKRRVNIYQREGGSYGGTLARGRNWAKYFPKMKRGKGRVGERENGRSRSKSDFLDFLLARSTIMVYI